MIRPAAIALAALLLASSPALAGGGPALMLEDALAEALAAHPDLIAADASTRKARLEIEDLAVKRYALTAGIAAGAGAGQGGFLAVPPRDLPAAASGSAMTGTLALKVPLFDGWKTQEGIRAAEAGEEASLADREQARVTVVLAATKAFWAVRQAELKLAIQKQALGQAQRAVVLAQEGLRSGRQSRHDVEQAEAAVAATLADLTGLEAAVWAARVELATLLGRKGADFATAGDPPEAPAGPAPEPDGASIEAALARRGDVRASRARVRQAEAKVAAALGGLWPEIDANASYAHGIGTVTQGGAVGGTGYSGEARAGVTGSYDFFDLGTRGRKVEEARQDLIAARAALESAERKARSELRAAAYRAAYAASRAMLLNRAVELAARNHDWVLARKEQGYGLALEVEDARSKLTIAEQNRIGARIDFVLQMAEYRAALGEL